MQRSALCRSRRELSNEYLLAKIGFDTAETSQPRTSLVKFARSPRTDPPGSPSGVSGAHVQNPAELDKLRATELSWGTKIVDPRAMDTRRRRRPATRTSAKRASTANTPCGQTGELARQRAEMVRNYVFSNSKLDRIFSSFYVSQCFLTFRKPCPEKCKHILGGISGKLRRI